MKKVKVGITIGDLNGVGLEVVLKTLYDSRILHHCTPIIYGSSKVVSYHKNIVKIDLDTTHIKSIEHCNDDKVNICNCWQENVNITLGQATMEGGKYALKALEGAVNDLKYGLIDAIVTAPINKYAMQMAEFPYPGHTEYLTQALDAKESLMLMMTDNLKIGVVTNHIPVHQISKAITPAKILQKLTILNDTLKVDFGIEKPTIAILGLNPHAGDGGVIGSEENKIIRPTIEKAKEAGILAMGPFPADGFFGSGQYQKYDAVLAMYHDQGLIPFKLLSFGAGVNYTAGLSGVRTSPDHGTAYDIVGKNEASPQSFRNALFSAIDIARNRKSYFEMRENALQKQHVAENVEDEVLPDEEV